jgi:hypothetical protein
MKESLRHVILEVKWVGRLAVIDMILQVGKACSESLAVAFFGETLAKKTNGCERGTTTARRGVASFERELAQLGPISTFSSDSAGVLSISTPAGGVSATPPTLAANRPLDLEV